MMKQELRQAPTKYIRSSGYCRFITQGGPIRGLFYAAINQGARFDPVPGSALNKF